MRQVPSHASRATQHLDPGHRHIAPGPGAVRAFLPDPAGARGTAGRRRGGLAAAKGLHRTDLGRPPYNLSLRALRGPALSRPLWSAPHQSRTSRTDTARLVHFQLHACASASLSREAPTPCRRPSGTAAMKPMYQRPRSRYASSSTSRNPLPRRQPARAGPHRPASPCGSSVASHSANGFLVVGQGERLWNGSWRRPCAGYSFGSGPHHTRRWSTSEVFERSTLAIGEQE